MWFILFLFIISLFALLVIKYIPHEKVSLKIEKVNIIGIVLLFVPIWLMAYLGAFGVYSFGRYFTLYLLGYYLFTSEKIIYKMVKNKKLILGLFCLFQLLLVVVYYHFSYYGDIFVNFVGWLGTLSCIIIGKLFLNNKSKITNY